MYHKILILRIPLLLLYLLESSSLPLPALLLPRDVTTTNSTIETTNTTQNKTPAVAMAGVFGVLIGLVIIGLFARICCLKHIKHKKKRQFLKQSRNNNISGSGSLNEQTRGGTKNNHNHNTHTYQSPTLTIPQATPAQNTFKIMPMPEPIIPKKNNLLSPYSTFSASSPSLPLSSSPSYPPSPSSPSYPPSQQQPYYNYQQNNFPGTSPIISPTINTSTPPSPIIQPLSQLHPMQHQQPQFYNYYNYQQNNATPLISTPSPASHKQQEQQPKITI
ncbi:2627_t:CDS:2 [Entrophospora sp. SA101]|nr:2627_t:CDS:2 [Entrophospora sp. SA101]